MSEQIIRNKQHGEWLKLFAIIAMVIDHAGYLFFPEYTWMRLVGRIAFPIFAYQVAIGYLHTSNKNRYMIRLWSFALLSQIPYTLLFETFSLNILFTLLLAVFLIDRADKKQWSWFFPALLITTSHYFIPNTLIFDYDWYGAFLPVVIYLLRNRIHVLMATLSTLTIVYVWIGFALGIGFPQQLFAVAVFAGILYLPSITWSLSLPKRFFYWFYPTHLFILLIIKFYLVFG